MLHAGRSDSTAARTALALLCRTYWYPLYAYIRRRGCAPDDAEDLTQGFFARLLELNSLADVRREKGRFRSFLSEEALRVAVHRLRQRYRHLLRDEIGQTVETPAEVDEEIRHLFQALAG